jgi:hypothetical protein
MEIVVLVVLVIVEVDIIPFKHEVNPRPSYIKYTIQFLSELSKAVGVEKRLEDFTKDDILLYTLIVIGNQTMTTLCIGGSVATTSKGLP